MRWQLSPIYINLVILKYNTKYTKILLLCFILLAALLCLIFPIPQLLEEQIRCGIEEYWFAGDNDISNLLSILYYPMEDIHSSTDNATNPWLYPSAIRSFSKFMRVPQSTFSYLKRVTTQSIIMARLSTKRHRFPIVFVSHGIASMPAFHTSLCQSLAAGGYIVVFICHNDGTALYPGPYQTKLEGNVSYKQRNFASPRPFANAGGGQMERDATALRDLLKVTATTTSYAPDYFEDYRQWQLKLRVREIQTAYEQVKVLTQTNGAWIKDRIDWESAAIIGFGYGGSSALLASMMQHPQFRSTILVSPHFDFLKESDLVRSYETIVGSSDSRLPCNNYLLLNTNSRISKKTSNIIRVIKIMQTACGDRIVAKLRRCECLDLTDVSLISPRLLSSLGVSGPRDPRKSQQMGIRVITNFLNHHQKKKRKVGPPIILRKARTSGHNTTGSETDGLNSTPSPVQSPCIKSTIFQVLAAATIPDQYIRSIAGIKSNMEFGTFFGVRKSKMYFDPLDGILNYADEVDFKEFEKAAEIYHI